MAGIILGPLISGALYQWDSRMNFFILCLCYFLVLTFLFFLRRYLRVHPSADESASLGEVSLLKKAPLPRDAANGKPDVFGVEAGTTDKRLDLYRYRGWVSGLFSSLFVGVLVNIVPLHIRDGLGYTERYAGTILFLRGVISFLGFAILARFTAWHFSRRWFLFLHSGLMLCTIILMLAGNRLYLFVIPVVLYGFIYAACYNNSMFYSGATGRNSKKNLALHEIFLSIGNIAGTAGGGFFYQHFRFTGTCIAMFLTLGAGLGIFALFNQRDKGTGLYP
jgi:predicted MFS family arabinose efflux permease